MVGLPTLKQESEITKNILDIVLYYILTFKDRAIYAT
jgi:hypothetical protein